MITVPAIKMQQHDVTFYLLNLAASDVERLVRFEVLGYDAGRATVKGSRRSRGGSRVNWSLLEERIRAGDGAYQRPIIKKKIEELVAYYRDCRSYGRLPAIPGTVLLTTDADVDFSEDRARLPPGGAFRARRPHREPPHRPRPPAPRPPQLLRAP